MNSANSSATEPETAKAQLAAAFRAAAMYGFVEGIDNHFSLTMPGRPDQAAPSADR
ncbi:hypothetical protein AB0I53_17005 [Saccharopolyspora sp. NPDC050389]|uniref:hypothetical protein n=1 Tax=Saccharopolyspora sp. NPDC050389 TaxID=3155516 RepID=UPI0033C7B2ED